jgi:hypothetical protein
MRSISLSRLSILATMSRARVQKICIDWQIGEIDLHVRCDSDPEDLHYFVYVLAHFSGRWWVSTPAPEHANRSVRSITHVDAPPGEADRFSGRCG